VFFPATGESVHENFTAPPEETSSSARRNPLRFAVAPRISLSTARAYEGGDTKGRGGGGRSLNLYEEGTISRARTHPAKLRARDRRSLSPDDSCESLLSELSPPPPSPAFRSTNHHRSQGRERRVRILAKRILAAERVTTKSSEGKTFRERDVQLPGAAARSTWSSSALSFSLSLFLSFFSPASLSLSLSLSPRSQRNFIIPHGELFSDTRGFFASRRR